MAHKKKTRKCGAASDQSHSYSRARRVMGSGLDCVLMWHEKGAALPLTLRALTTGGGRDSVACGDRSTIIWL